LNKLKKGPAAPTTQTSRRVAANNGGTPRRSHGKKRRKTHNITFFRRIPLWAIVTGVVLIVAGYVFFFYYFFVNPFSFRWQAIYGEANDPEGFEIRGIDISHYQDRIDWERLRNANVQRVPLRFVFVKATEGVSMIDENFSDNFYQARQNDLIRGAYHFFVPDADARKQARFYLKQVHLEEGDLPPVLDVEKVGRLSSEQLRKAVRTWLEIVEEHYGVKPILYTGASFKKKYLNDSIFNQYPYWIAHYYVEKPTYEGSWKFWQYTDFGKIDGIQGNVDCNIFNGSLQDLRKMTISAETLDNIGL
jgi:lysozyme